MKKILLMAITFFLIGVAFADNTVPIPNRTIIAGHFTDGRTDTLTLTIFEQRLGITQTGGIQKIVYCHNGYFTIELPEIPEIVYYSLSSKSWPKLYLNNYLVETGDSIFIKIDPLGLPANSLLAGKRLTFSGKNATKNEVKYFADSIIRKDEQTKAAAGPLASYRQPRFDSTCISIGKDFDPLLQKMLTALENYKENISEKAYPILYADTYYQKLIRLLAAFNNGWEMLEKDKDKSERKTYLMEDYKTSIENKILTDYPPQSTTLLSAIYLDFVVRKTMTDARIMHGYGSPLKATDYLVYFRQWPPPTREAAYTSLAAYLYTYTPDVTGTDVYLDSIITKVNTPYLESILNHYQSSLHTGAIIFPFRLPDASGNTIAIESFKGKTVVIDFWFTGCTACIKLAKVMRMVKETIGSNKDIVYMSISTDEDKNIWLKSLQKGNYTDPGNINLFTEGQGVNHPLTKYYSFHAFPKMLIIDTFGKIVSSDPPFPRSVADIPTLARFIQDAADHH